MWLAFGQPAGAQLAPSPPGDAPARPADLRDRLTAAVQEAARFSGLPAWWIEAVMAAESGGDPLAVSRAGAMGLMQLMPRTWWMLRARLGLGSDPFDVRDNLLAGAAYLREMHDRFGVPGFLAAYNAGPARYADHLAGRRPLPAETRAYVGRLASQIGAGGPAPLASAASWTFAPLFPPAPGAEAGASASLFARAEEARAP
jgi:soluble lytic murein transglycosylase-like protein